MDFEVFFEKSLFRKSEGRISGEGRIGIRPYVEDGAGENHSPNYVAFKLDSKVAIELLHDFALQVEKCSTDNLSRAALSEGINDAQDKLDRLKGCIEGTSISSLLKKPGEWYDGEELEEEEEESESVPF